jgi:hypothetical protein
MQPLCKKGAGPEHQDDNRQCVIKSSLVPSLCVHATWYPKCIPPITSNAARPGRYILLGWSEIDRWGVSPQLLICVFYLIPKCFAIDTENFRCMGNIVLVCSEYIHDILTFYFREGPV